MDADLHREYGSSSQIGSWSQGEKQRARARKAKGEKKEGPEQVGASSVWRGGKGRREIREGPRGRRRNRWRNTGGGGWCEDSVSWSNKSYLYTQGGPDQGWGTLLSCPCLGAQAGRGTSRCSPCSTLLMWRDLGCLSLWGRLPCLLYLRASPSKSWHWGELHQWFSKCVLQTACWEP